MNTKKLLLVGVLLIISCISVFGLLDRGHIGGDWGYGSSPFLNVDYDENFNEETLNAVGNDKYPTVCDLDADGDKEIIGFSGSTLYIYSLEGSGVSAQDSENIGSTILNVACVVDPFDPNLDDKLVLVITSSKAQGYYFNGATISAGDTFYTFPYTISKASQPHCTEFYDGGLSSNDFDCVFGDDTRIYLINGVSGDDFYINSTHNSTFNVIYDRLNDYIYSATYDTIWVNDVYDPDNSTATARTQLYNTTSSYLGASSPLSSYNDVFGGEYVCQSFDDTDSASGQGSGDTHFACVNSNAVLFSDWDGTGVATSFSQSSIPIFYDIDLDNDIEVCWEYRIYGTSSISEFMCFDMAGNRDIDSLNSPYFGTPSFTTTIGNMGEIDVPRILTYSGTDLLGL